MQCIEESINHQHPHKHHVNLCGSFHKVYETNVLTYYNRSNLVNYYSRRKIAQPFKETFFQKDVVKLCGRFLYKPSKEVVQYFPDDVVGCNGQQNNRDNPNKIRKNNRQIGINSVVSEPIFYRLTPVL